MYRTVHFFAHLTRNAHPNTDGSNAMPSDDETRQILSGPGASHWLKDALTSALDRELMNPRETTQSKTRHVFSF